MLEAVWVQGCGGESESEAGRVATLKTLKPEMPLLGTQGCAPKVVPLTSGVHMVPTKGLCRGTFEGYDLIVP